MRLIFYLIILFSFNALALTNYESSAIGCRGISQSFKFKIQGSVHILQSYYDNLSSGQQQAAVQDQIEKQIKYLIGISKEFRSVQIAKFAISGFRSEFEILKKTVALVRLPELNPFWGPNITLGDSPYVKELVLHSKQEVLVKKIDYQTDIILTTCGYVPLSTVTVYSEFENLFFPLDPYLGFWVNGPDERKIITAKNGKVGLVPNCLSQDFLIFGTAPEYGWFYWQPVHRDVARLCQIKNKSLVTKFKIQRIETLTLKKETSIFATDSIGTINLAAAFGQVSHSANGLAKQYDILFNEIHTIFDHCQNGVPDRVACFSELDQYLKANQNRLDPGQSSLIHVLKYYAAMVIDHKVIPEKIHENYVQFKLTGKSAFDKKNITFSIYAGPTGVFQSYLAPTEYWNFVLKSFYQDDLFLYFGHAGVGNNLAFKTILQRASLNPAAFNKRTKNLNLGIFNCEAYSYFGWDLDSLFDQKSTPQNYVSMVASSGVEVSSTFLSAYIENILKAEDLKVGAVIENFSGYVLSNDFLTFQKIQSQ